MSRGRLRTCRLPTGTVRPASDATGSEPCAKRHGCTLTVVNREGLSPQADQGCGRWLGPSPPRSRASCIARAWSRAISASACRARIASRSARAASRAWAGPVRGKWTGADQGSAAIHNRCHDTGLQHTTPDGSEPLPSPPSMRVRPAPDARPRHSPRRLSSAQCADACIRVTRRRTSCPRPARAQAGTCGTTCRPSANAGMRCGRAYNIGPSRRGSRSLQTGGVRSCARSPRRRGPGLSGSTAVSRSGPQSPPCQGTGGRPSIRQTLKTVATPRNRQRGAPPRPVPRRRCGRAGNGARSGSARPSHQPHRFPNLWVNTTYKLLSALEAGPTGP